MPAAGHNRLYASRIHKPLIVYTTQKERSICPCRLPKRSCI